MLSLALVSAVYVAAQILADIASLRIVMLWGLSIDGGTFIYPLTFTLRDMVHKIAGVETARALIIAAAVINIVMALMFWGVSLLPPDMNVGPQSEFALVLAPMWRIVTASILAEVISELLDTEAYNIWVTRVTTRYQWARVLVSNAVSVPIDSLIFGWMAFGGSLPASVVWSIVLSNVLIKGAVTLLSLPSIYLVKDRQQLGYIWDKVQNYK